MCRPSGTPLRGARNAASGANPLRKIRDGTGEAGAKARGIFQVVTARLSSAVILRYRSLSPDVGANFIYLGELQAYEYPVEKHFQETASTQRSLHFAPPDFLSRSVEFIRIMRFPLRKTAYVSLPASRRRKSGHASVEMTKGRWALPERVVAERKPLCSKRSKRPVGKERSIGKFLQEIGAFSQQTVYVGATSPGTKRKRRGPAPHNASRSRSLISTRGASG